MCMGALNYNSYLNQKREQQDRKAAAVNKTIEARESRAFLTRPDRTAAGGYEESLG